MEFLQNNPLIMIIIAGIGAGILVGGYMIAEKKGINLFTWWHWPPWGSREKVHKSADGKPGDAGGKKKRGKDEYSPAQVRLYDNKTRTVYNTELSGEIVGKIRKADSNLGRKWNRAGKWLYAINLKEDGEYRVLVVPSTLDDPPSSLYRALQQQAVEIFYDVSADQNFMEKYGKILLFVGAVLFLIWTVVMK